MNPISLSQRYIPAMCFLSAALWAAPMALAQQGQQGAEQEQLQVARAPDQTQAPPQVTWNEVRIVHVKGDRVPDFERLVKQLSTALAEQGEGGMGIWQVMYGDQNTYHIASQFSSLASIEQMAEKPPMPPEQMREWVSQIEGTIDSHELALWVVREDLSIMPQAQQGEAGPGLLLLVTANVSPGKGREYEDWLRDELIPALRDSDFVGVVTNQAAFGEEERSWGFAIPMPGLAALDEPMPLYASMGREAAEAMMSRGDALTESSETIILRPRPDLAMPETEPAAAEDGAQPQ